MSGWTLLVVMLPTKLQRMHDPASRNFPFQSSDESTLRSGISCMLYPNLSVILIVPDVLGAVGEPHSVMPVARTASAGAAPAAAAVEMVVACVAVVTQIAAAAAAAPANSEGGLLGLVAPPEIGRDMIHE